MLLAIFLVFTNVANAGERRFTYVYEATTATPGKVDVENWVTWKHDAPAHADNFDFRHEVEFGLNDRLQLGIYLANWTLTGDEHHARYESSAVEVIYNLSNPTTDFLGAAVYGELKVGDRLLALEGKAILQKNVGRWMLAYNVSLEAEWEGAHLDERNGEIQQTAGVSYELSPRFLLGAEMLHEVTLPDWANRGDSVVSAGPNFSYRHANWWFTVTPLAQLSDVDDEAHFQTRVIFGVTF